MVDNITDMANTLQEFVQTFYPTLDAKVGSSLTPYIALTYMGLQDSSLYQEQVVATGHKPPLNPTGVNLTKVGNAVIDTAKKAGLSGLLYYKEGLKTGPSRNPF
jgi:hypothetical protein